MMITPRASAPDSYLAYASQSDLPNKQDATKQTDQSVNAAATASDASLPYVAKESQHKADINADSVTLSKEAMTKLQDEQAAKQGASDKLKDQMISKRQQELSQGSKTNEEIKQEQIQATKDEIKKVKEALQKLQHKEGEMVEKQKDQLNLALVQLNTQLLELMRS